jgi:hypothetical protein
MSVRKALLLALAAASGARADGTSTTLFDSSPYTRDGGHTDNSFYEQFALNAKADGTDWLQDVHIVARGWGRLTVGDSFDGHTGAGDLDSFFLEGRLLKRHVLVRVGRQLAVGGAARALQLDGLSVDAVVAHGFGTQGWIGVPVQPQFGQAAGDFMTGARLFWRHAFDSEVGASYVYILRRGYLSREDLAFDGSWTPLRPVTLSGLFQYSIAGDRVAEGRLAALWQIDRKLQVTADYQYTAPDLFLDQSSIFAVFAEENRNEAGGEVVYKLLPQLTLDGDLHWLHVDGGAGARGGVRATYRMPTGTNYGAEFRVLDQPDNGYTLARVFGVRKLPRNLTVTLDLDAYWLQQEINNYKHSFVATLTGGWGFRPNWEAMLAGSLGTTPYYEHRTEIIARLVYRFGIPAAIPGGFK